MRALRGLPSSASIAAISAIAVACTGAASASARTPGPKTLARYADGAPVSEPAAGHGYAAWYSDGILTGVGHTGRRITVLGPSGTKRSIAVRRSLDGTLAIVAAAHGRTLVIARCRPVHGPCPSRTFDARTLKPASLGALAGLYRSSSARGWFRAAADGSVSVEVASGVGAGSCDVLQNGAPPVAPSLATVADCSTPRAVQLRGTMATFVAEIAPPGATNADISTQGIFAADLRQGAAGWALIGTRTQGRGGGQGATGSALAANGIYTVDGTTVVGDAGETSYGPQTLSRWSLSAAAGSQPTAPVTRSPVNEPGRIESLTSTGPRLIALEDVVARGADGVLGHESLVRSLPLLP